MGNQLIGCQQVRIPLLGPQYHSRAHESLGEADGRDTDRRVTLKESIGKRRGTHVHASAIVEADVRVITAHMHERSVNARI